MNPSRRRRLSKFIGSHPAGPPLINNINARRGIDEQKDIFRKEKRKREKREKEKKNRNRMKKKNKLNEIEKDKILKKNIIIIRIKKES